LTTQGNRYRVAFGIFLVTCLHVIGTYRDRNLITLVGIDDGQTIKLDFGHHALHLSCQTRTYHQWRGLQRANSGGGQDILASGSSRERSTPTRTGRRWPGMQRPSLTASLSLSVPGSWSIQTPTP